MITSENLLLTLMQLESIHTQYNLNFIVVQNKSGKKSQFDCSFV